MCDCIPAVKPVEWIIENDHPVCSWLHLSYIAGNQERHCAFRMKWDHTLRLRLDAQFKPCSWNHYMFFSSRKINIFNTGWWFQPLWKIWKSVGIIIPNIYGSKPPTRTSFDHLNIVKPTSHQAFPTGPACRTGHGPQGPQDLQLRLELRRFGRQAHGPLGGEGTVPGCWLDGMGW